MVMAHCLVQVLSARYGGGPQSGDALELHLAAPPAVAPLGRRMPGVDAVHVLEADHGELALEARWRLARRLAPLAFDQAIVLPNSFKAALVPWWAGIRRRTGWVGEQRFLVLNDRRRLVRDHYPLMIERFMALGLDDGVLLEKPYPRPELSVDADNVGRLIREHGLEAEAVALCPGAAFGPAKRWPATHYAELARSLTAAGRQVWLLGGPKDTPVCTEIEGLVPTGLVNLAGRTSLTDVVDLLSVASAAVSNDSGLMHVAGAVGTPLVALYGSTSPDFTPPLGERKVVLRQALPCSPCFERSCPLGHTDCLNTLSPRMVLDALEAA
jgi:heptosyltransferase-2